MTLRNTEDYYQKLAEKWLSGKITAEEEKEFSDWYGKNQDLPIDIPATHANNEQEMHDRLLDKIKSEIKIPAPKKVGHISYYILAACLTLFIVSFFVYFIKSDAEQTLSASANHDIPPGRNKATLKLADGSVINLDDVTTGKIVEQEGINVVKEADGLITYKVNPDKKSGHDQFNTIATPLGGQYKIILPDGTKVWLNAGSTLEYPTSFSGKQRLVKLFGEGYFEVAKNKEMPFKVSTNSQEIVVLGTHFNINAYADEPVVKTTLVEGSVRVMGRDIKQKTSDNTVVLKPGEQSSLSKNNKLSVKEVNVAAEIAWKSGIFSFQNTDIQVVARELSRWYNVKIAFEGALPDVKLWGEMDRNVSATEALEILHYFKLKYRVVQEGKSKMIMISK